MTDPKQRARRRFAVAGQWEAGWWAATYLLIDMLTGVVAIVLGSLAIAGVAAIAGLGIGLLLLIPALLGCQWLGEFERSRIESMLGVSIEPATPQENSSWWRPLLTAEGWRPLGYVWLLGLWGIFASGVVLALVINGVRLFASPVFSADGSIPYLVRDAPALWRVALGLALVVVTPLLANLMVHVDQLLVRWLVGADPAAQIERLEQRVDTLRASRESVVDSVEAERQRIERDLHDGPQQRLVAIAMELGMAKQALETNPEDARALIDRAHAASKEAVLEMRQVARGITPPVLADRGLDAALSAVAARSPVPVTIDFALAERPPPAVEAIAYFCVSESLTNVAKHASATQAWVKVARDDRGLVIEVSDDGHGGADPERGTGLRGLAARAGAVDGTVQIDSPEGGPTKVTVVLPSVMSPSTTPEEVS